MGLKNIISDWFGGSPASIQQLPAGSVTVDRQGTVITSTVSSAYPQKVLHAIGNDVLEIFHEARAAHMPLAEITLRFGSLRLTARELRGGAIIFFYPQTALMPDPSRL
ncbi:MAG TPA: hypothetical protein VGO57_18445 [Verrucomicrobiae bacterium]|jgi:hypothetical protein